ncbi:hypothetical protein CCH79_00015317 [Gambusia affinis]|uniref:Myelin gene regulatory factor C-terminal domain-containing protein n=1 Tax=Gambusia affinis TaxID=33528 RepID=A0A315W556_GAMAF|nr:hypothetical protein CCH79_00015317 [Gambusia affinis]
MYSYYTADMLTVQMNYLSSQGIPVPTPGTIVKKAKSRQMDKDGHNRNRLSHTSAPMYFAKSKRPVSPDAEGVGTTNRLPPGQQPPPRRQRSLHAKGTATAPSLKSVHIVETNQEITSQSCESAESCRSRNSVWVKQCGATKGRLCPNHTESELYSGQSTSTKGTHHLWSVPVLSFQDVTYHFRVSHSGEVSCATEEKIPLHSDYHFFIQSSCV